MYRYCLKFIQLINDTCPSPLNRLGELAKTYGFIHCLFVYALGWCQTSPPQKKNNTKGIIKRGKN